MGKRNYHLQNLQEFQSKFEVEKQGLWSEVETKKTFNIDFDHKHLRPKKFL